MNKILREIWGNLDRPGARYVPRSNGIGSGWNVFDKAKGRFLEDREVRKIDPTEMLAN